MTSTEHYEHPESLDGTVFDPTSDTFGPIMREIQAGNFRRASDLLTRLETFNGWANYPTWAVSLWLSNDEVLYMRARSMLHGAARLAPNDPNALSGTWTAEETKRFRLADRLKRWVTDDLAPDLGASFAADLLGYALDQVDWQEIADAWIEDES